MITRRDDWLLRKYSVNEATPQSGSIKRRDAITWSPDEEPLSECGIVRLSMGVIIDSNDDVPLGS